MQSVAILKKRFEEYAWWRPLDRAMAINDAGLVLGAGTVLAETARDPTGAPVLKLEGHEERLLALLSVAYRGNVSSDLFRRIERASKQWMLGDKCLAHIELAYANLPKLENNEDAFSLYLADALIDDGMSPRTLLKELGHDRTLLDLQIRPHPASRPGRQRPDERPMGLRLG